MILGIGTDIVQVDRFMAWSEYSKSRLLKIFSEKELLYCSNEQKDCKYNLECLASRFAAKEAFFKALSSTLVKLEKTGKTFPFLFACQNVEIVKTTWQIPYFKINWEAFENKIENKLPKLKAHLSISHEKNYTVSFVLICLS